MKKIILAIAVVIALALVGTFAYFHFVPFKANPNATGYVACPKFRKIQAFDFSLKCYGLYRLDNNVISFTKDPTGFWMFGAARPEPTNFPSIEEWISFQPKSDDGANKSGIHLLKYLSSKAGKFAIYKHYMVVGQNGQTPIYGYALQASLISKGKIYSLQRRIGTYASDKDFEDLVSSFAL